MKEVVQLPSKHQAFSFPLYTGYHSGLGQMSQAGTPCRRPNPQRKRWAHRSEFGGIKTWNFAKF
jgi:hypothetical protein